MFLPRRFRRRPRSGPARWVGDDPQQGVTVGGAGPDDADLLRAERRLIIGRLAGYVLGPGLTIPCEGLPKEVVDLLGHDQRCVFGSANVRTDVDLFGRFCPVGCLVVLETPVATDQHPMIERPSRNFGRVCG
jgi:hypothetical protein